MILRTLVVILFPSVITCTALVGDSKTLSFQPSVHIPFINFPHSSISSRNEVFKEMKDVGQYNSISSLHLFHENLDLPPSAYHYSLEELWNADQELAKIEAVMKVVPSSNHHFLDLFSRVKADKHPPYHFCDHHVELKGSLPPIGVIYSFSNEDSETLRA
ncbi:hypothetical protein O181_009959 [Austropuccinia psidii MF-1]|uniref:Uncharacterized protein n=1 Tax=Austropuccinia psidii MF-1 TaxID=1389203 RepID=A0A9Q3GKD3_9BASI|nr:hypothetical protein [Austropuccinia psidii MF-1]